MRWKLAPERFARAAKHAEIGELTDTEAAYIAGMIDADGVVTVGAGKRPSPVVLVTNSNFGLIEWLLSKICAGSAYETKAAPKRPDQNAERWNKVHRHQLTGRKAQTLLSRCRPYMLVKARQADLVTQLPTRGRDFGRVATAGQREFAGQIKSQVRALNARGRRPDHVI